MRLHFTRDDPRPLENVLCNKKFYSHAHLNGRVDNIEIKRVNNKLIMDKTTYFGNTNPFDGHLRINDYIKIAFPLDKGIDNKLIQSSIVGGDAVNGFQVNDTLKDTYFYKNPINNSKSDTIMPKIHDFNCVSDRFEIRDNRQFIYDRYHFEDMFNLSFGDLLKSILLSLSLFNLEIPFKMDIKIDNLYGIKVENLYFAGKDNSINELCKERIRKCMKHLHKQFYLFKNYADHENRHIGVYVHFDYFDTIIHINDYDYRMTHFINLSNSDHYRVLKSLAFFTDGKTFWDDESFHMASKDNFHSVTDIMYNDPDEINDFAEGELKYHRDILEEDYKDEISHKNFNRFN